MGEFLLDRRNVTLGRADPGVIFLAAIAPTAAPAAPTAPAAFSIAVVGACGRFGVGILVTDIRV